MIWSTPPQSYTIMNITKYRFSAFIAFLFFCNHVYADIVFQIDMDTTVAGIQSTRSVDSGTTFDVDLIMRLTNSSTVSAFSLGVNFDRNEVQVTSVNTSVRPNGFGQVNTLVFDNNAGTIRPFDALAFSSLDSNFSGLIGTITVNANNPITDALVDFTPIFSSPGIDGVLDGAGQTVPVGGAGGIFFQGGTLNITAVPEPSTCVLCSAVLSFIYVAKRRRQKVV